MSNVALAKADHTITPLKKLDFVLVKFTFGNFNNLPPGILPVKRDSDQRVDVKHQIEAAKHRLDGSLTTVGRHREGRVDTGEPVLKDPKLSHAGMLRRGLVNNDFRLTSLHYYKRPGADKSKDPRCTVVASYSPFKEDAPLELTDSVNAALHELASMAWLHVSVWDNPNNSQTVNFGGMQKGAKPLHAIRTLDGIIQATPVTEFLREDEE